MKVSYIIPVYKVESYIRQCVESVLAQSLDESEIILVDDGSPDGCPQICDEYAKAYPEKIKVIHKENGGLADARNHGLAQARGEYIFFVDSDDFLVGDRISELYAKAVENNADVVHTTYVSLNDDTGETENHKLPYEKEVLYDHDKMEKEICSVFSKFGLTFVWRNLYRREFLTENGITFAKHMKMVEDGPFNMWAYCASKRFVAVDIPVYCYRIRDDSLQRKKYVPDYDEWLNLQWKLKVGYYEKYCTPSPLFYEDLAQYNIKALLPLLLRNVYINKIPDRRKFLKRIGDSDMMRKSFDDYDINKFRSKSLDWLMTKFVKNRNYFMAHLICEKVLYK